MPSVTVWACAVLSDVLRRYLQMLQTLAGTWMSLPGPWLLAPPHRW